MALCLGVVAAGALVVALRPTGYRLTEDEVDAAREHVRTRDALRAVESELAVLDPESEAAAELTTRGAVLRLQLATSAFSDVPLDDLREGLAAAANGDFADAADVAGRAYYGKDDRKDLGEVIADREKTKNRYEREYLDEQLAVARGVGAWIPTTKLTGPAGGPQTVFAETLGEALKLCRNQRFRDQPNPAVGTAFLVREDVVVTAAHVLDVFRNPKAQLRLVFDFEVRDDAPPTTVRRVYSIKKILDRRVGREWDWAVVRLDRKVEDARVLELAGDTRPPHLKAEDSIYLWGHSSGTPKKLMPGTVVKNSAGSKVIHVEVDAFGGDSGSPVLNRHHKVVGVFWGGSRDWARSRRYSNCYEARRLSRGDDYERVTSMEQFRNDIPRR